MRFDIKGKAHHCSKEFIRAWLHASACVLEYHNQFSGERKQYCCEFMKQQLTHECEIHGEGSACPDVVIGRSDFQGGEGKIHLIARNAEYVCNFCPWCGRKWRKA